MQAQLSSQVHPPLPDLRHIQKQFVIKFEVNKAQLSSQVHPPLPDLRHIQKQFVIKFEVTSKKHGIQCWDSRRRYRIDRKYTYGLS
ncbi:hypothetical protein L1987_66578 [Smallanthus sonchifolius]|uniref:Uncharacterized protein n=1 Tax=Smallanthus sonchifolius TaxID=185202 RepID=A0ACB9BXU6_9ASTR|nr:hypothetical protein L1987_66578 [Smallanthus sonchifolius]